jgi:phage baseplate assembly protein W
LGWGKKIARSMEKTILTTNVGSAARLLYGSVLEIHIFAILAIADGGKFKKI